jgi:ABC-2 type transport system permease protein
LSVSFVLYFKQSDPINFFINIILSVFSGIIYPVTVLPLFMQNIANYIPLTKQLNSTRQVLINNFLDPYIYSNLFFMHLFLSIFFLLLCFYVFQISIYAVKKNGTIGTY